MRGIFYYHSMAGIILSAMCLSSCSDNSAIEKGDDAVENKPETVEQKPIVLSDSERAVSTAVNTFGLESFAELLEDDNLRNSSFVYSPLSLSLNLALCQTGARGETARQIQSTLGFENMVAGGELESYYRKISKGLAAVDTTVTFNSANAVWGDIPVVFNNVFAEKADAFFGTSLETLDMHSDGAIDVINRWCGEKTDGMIPQLFSRPWDDTPLVLIANALCFNAKWPKGMTPSVKDGIFHSLAGDVSLPFLKFEGFFLCFETESFQAISIPYGNGSYNILLAMPREGKTVQDVVLNIGDSVSDIISLVEDSIIYNVDCSFPEFKIDAADIHLRNMLEKVGMVNPFYQGIADFGAMANCDDLFITDILQKACIDVNKEGTSAAAATASEMGSFNPEQELRELTIDRPFFFMVYEIGSGTILFEGQKI